jgi:DNA-binding HxlR family transcriptional regulator
MPRKPSRTLRQARNVRPGQSGRGARPRRSRCPVSCTLDVLGDRWSLLVVRDLMRGKRRYAEFLASSEGIPTNILADRLKRLVTGGIVESKRYSERPPRLEYSLTPKGEDLRPMMRAMVDWGIRHAGGKVPTPYQPPA